MNGQKYESIYSANKYSLVNSPAPRFAKQPESHTYRQPPTQPSPATRMPNNTPQNMDLARMRAYASPQKPGPAPRPQMDTSQTRRAPSGNQPMELSEGGRLRSTEGRNPLLVSFGETSRDHSYSRSGVYSESKIFSNSIQNAINKNTTEQGHQQHQPMTGISEANSMVGGGMHSISHSVGNKYNVRSFQNNNREELELLRSKNKAFISGNKEKFPDFLAKIEKMGTTVHKNIHQSFSTKIKEIWKSYINDQSTKSELGGSVQGGVPDLEAIEHSSISCMASHTDQLILKLKLSQLEEINKQLVNQTEQDLDPNHPLYALEIDARMQRDLHDHLQATLERTLKEDELLLYELRKKQHLSMAQHIESYRREYQMKMCNDHTAIEKLQTAREFYSKEISRMSQDLKRGAAPFEATHEQNLKIKELESRISNLLRKANAY